MLKVGIVGSRKFPAKELVEAFVLIIAEYDIMVVSGACPNSPDQWAVDKAKELNIPYKEFPADWNSKGTLDTVIKTIKARKPVVTVTALEGLQEAYDAVKNLAKPMS